MDQSRVTVGRRAGRSITRVGVVALLATLALPPAWASAQTDPGSPSARESLIDQLVGATGGAARVSTHRATGLTRFLTTDPGRPVPRVAGVAPNTDAEAAARGFLGSYGPLFGIADQAASLELMNEKAAAGGRRSVRFGQTHKGIPVIAGELIVSVDAQGNVLSANGETTDAPAIDVVPSVGEAAARQIAVDAVAKAQGVPVGAVQSESASLAVYDPRLLGGPGPGIARLVWRTEVASSTDTFHELVLVDAHTGTVLLHFDEHAEAKNRQVCDRNNVAGAPLACTSGFARVEGQGPTGNVEVDRAFDFAGQTYDFYFSKFGRDSLNGAGLTLKSTVRYCPDAFNCPFQNAFWNGSQMVYGDGFTVDDVVGHELTHGVTDFESHLYYFAQSGAINESLSDVFGEFVDLGNTQGNDTAAARWLIGEDIGAIRDMENPPAFSDPDRMQSALYVAGYGDNAGVHLNSGVNNKAAFLLTDGGTFNGKTVTALGIDKVARIYYEANAHILTSGSDYADLYDVLQQACKNLTGTNGITAANCVEVKDAVDATQMNLQPTTGANVAEATLCPAGQIPANQFFDNLENTSSGNWAKSKVSGTTDFRYPPLAAQRWTTSGIQNFWGPNATTTSDFRIARTANVTPQVGQTTYLRFNHMYDLEFNFDGGVVEYSTNNGANWIDAGPLFDGNGYNDASLGGAGPLAGRATFTGFVAGYTSSRLNLSSLAGQAVRFRFRIGTDAGLGFQGWFIDDIRVYRCVAGSSAPTANAGPDLTVAHNTQFVLNGSGTDPEGKPLAWRWVQLSGMAATIRDPREQAAIVNGVDGGDSGQNLVFQLTVTDSQGLTATDTVNVHINPK